MSGDGGELFLEDKDIESQNTRCYGPHSGCEDGAEFGAGHLIEVWADGKSRFNSDKDIT